MIRISKNLSEEEIKELLIKNAYYYIQHVELSHNLCLFAVKIDGLTLKFIPKKIQTREICSEAVKQNSNALRFTSKKYIDDDLYSIAARSNNPSFNFIPKKFITQSICDEAITKNVRSISSIPNDFLTMELRKKAIEIDWRALGWLDERRRSKKLCMMAYKINAKAIKYFPQKFLTIELCEEAVKIDNNISVYIPEKYHSKIVIQALTERLQEVEINKEPLILKTEDEKFYENHVLSNVKLLDYTPVKNNEVISAEAILHEINFSSNFDNSMRSIYYISDIHLNHKIHDHFPYGASEKEIRSYLESVVDEMLPTIDLNERYFCSNDFILISGDVSFDFKISEIFYTLISNKLNRNNVIVTLGNHELWSETSKNPLSKIINQYRIMFDNLGIIFLENNLLTLTYDIDNPLGKLIKMSEHDIIQYSAEELQEICNRSSLIVFGAIGFSGLNKEFNYQNGIYRQTLESRNDEIQLSAKTKMLYNKLVESIGDYKVIIQTHMPFGDWCEKKYHPGWIYVNGHNHRNEFFISPEKTVFSDNQIGYKNSNIRLKRFNLTSNYDVFSNRKDGIYEINREDYLDFCKGLGIYIDFNRRDGKIIMLKREGYYLFLFKNDKGKLYLLKGGRPKPLDEDDINYYFENMSNYAYAIRKVFERYDFMLKAISNFIKSFGGSGTVHGCIIDIDFYSHIYLNPYDGSITPYYALSTVHKWVYKDIGSLLANHCPKLFERFLDISKNSIIEIETKSSIDYTITLSEYIPETDIYDPSRIIRSFQYLREVKVIREWHDDWVKSINASRINKRISTR